MKKIVEDVNQNAQPKKSSLSFMQSEYIDVEFEKMFAERNKVSPILDENNKLLLKDIFKNYLKLYILKLEEERLKAKEEQETKKPEVDEAKEEEAKKKEEEEKKKEDEEEKEDKTKEELEDEKDPNKAIKANEIGYLDRVAMLEIMTRDIAQEQIKNESYCADEQLYYKMLLFKKTLQNDEPEYLKGLDEKDKAILAELKEKMQKEELENERKIQETFDNKLNELEKLNNEWQSLNDELESLYKRQEDEQFDINDEKSNYKEMKASITSRMLDISKKVALLNPPEMKRQKEVKSKQMILQKSIMGPFKEQEEYNQASGSIKNEIDSKDNKQEKQSEKIEKESAFNMQMTLKRTIEINEKHIKCLEDKLEDTSPTNIELRSELLQEIQEVKVQNNNYIELEKTMSSSMEKEKDITLEVANTEKEIEAQTEEVEQNFEDVNTYIEKKEQKEADFVLEDPTESLDRETLEEEAIEDVEDYKDEPSVIPGLENQVYSPEESNSEYVKYIEEQDIRSQEKAMDELDKIEEQGQTM